MHFMHNPHSQWERDGVEVGWNGPDYSGDTGNGDFVLEVTVTDAFGNSLQDASSVTVDPGAPDCSA